MPTIVSIAYSPPSENPKPDECYARTSFPTAALVAGKGIVGDRKGKGGKRQLNIMSAAMLDQLHAEGFDNDPGQMGEQIVIAGVDVDNLPAGARLRLGSDAIIEVVMPRTGCDRFERIQKRLRSEVDGRLGVMARVIESGTIRVGDQVSRERQRPEEST